MRQKSVINVDGGLEQSIKHKQTQEQGPPIGGSGIGNIIYGGIYSSSGTNILEVRLFLPIFNQTIFFRADPPHYSFLLHF